MAIFMSNDVQVTVNSVDLSDHVTSLTWNETAAELDSTAMGDGNVTRIAGLKDGSLTIEFQQDFAASSVYATLYPLLGTVTTVTAKPTSGATATDNPQHSVSCLVTELALLDGGVADLSTFSVTWPFASAVTVTTA